MKNKRMSRLWLKGYSRRNQSEGELDGEVQVDVGVQGGVELNQNPQSEVEVEV